MPIITIFVIVCLISLWVYFRRGRSLGRAALTALALTAFSVALVWGGPLSSGALFLLLPAQPEEEPYELPLSYRPVHQGHVDLATGLYIREDEDVVLRDSPWFVWRRAYLSRDRVARHMGIGTTHNAEWYLSGDPNTVQRIDLIREDGARVIFDRTSRGSSFVNAMFIHTATPSGFYGARLGWVGQRWAMRFANGALAIFRGCDESDPSRACSLMSLRDPHGRMLWFRRDEHNLLRSVVAGSQQLTFEYDDQRRVISAANGSHAATYAYDSRGRLVRATVDGVARTYAYGPRDEMIAIEDPRRSIENTYDDGLRLTRQVVRRPGRPDRIETFAYNVEKGSVLETAVTNGNGSRTLYRWDENRRHTLEVHESEGGSPVMVQYARAEGEFVRAITVFCTSGGKPASETAEVVPGDESRTKAELIERVCD